MTTIGSQVDYHVAQLGNAQYKVEPQIQGQATEGSKHEMRRLSSSFIRSSAASLRQVGTYIKLKVHHGLCVQHDSVTGKRKNYLMMFQNIIHQDSQEEHSHHIGLASDGS